ncbi:relaxase/mobilization nuclease domain-containing protein (plasmid) [Chryseobacterium rhizoplanae]|uniref:relaxase/mobilization nuclease domain-containing protein n=1 Tax=Chryseobacterium rhizoplanae TaxID=1609531 RepID=UPI001CE31083|nr:relaxase/mobilization nuclease domain-containing protein [Chryseobacterium rhizoplanae]UCA62263.1 relaxase/mobilization nuclease domain-containing protein [Chryseobacterium rhizoplanae]
MIAKAKSVKGSLAGALYKERPDKDHEIIYQNNMFGETAHERWEELRDIANLNTRLENKYIENVVSPPKEIGDQLSREDWEKLAKDYALKSGYGENQWYAVLHQNTDEKHLHIYANRINFEGKNTIDSEKIGERSGKIAEELSQERGWKTAKEISSDKKADIMQCLENSVSSSRSWDQVASKMEEQGYVLELSYQDKNGIKTLNGARITPVEEYKGKEEMSRREQLSKKGYKLSEIDRNMKIKELDNKLKKNLEKSQNYGRSL